MDGNQKLMLERIGRMVWWAYGLTAVFLLALFIEMPYLAFGLLGVAIIFMLRAVIETIGLASYINTKHK
jgi:uncharacterized paraquat-inducible protein A